MMGFHEVTVTYMLYEMDRKGFHLIQQLKTFRSYIHMFQLLTINSTTLIITKFSFNSHSVTNVCKCLSGSLLEVEKILNAFAESFVFYMTI